MKGEINVLSKHHQLGLTDDQVIAMYEKMLEARLIDERLWLLNRAGKLPFVVSCQGQEGAQIGAAFAMDPTIDYAAPYYRDLGTILAFGQTPKDIMLHMYARAEDPNSGGRQMPGHYGSKKHHLMSISSPVSTQIPHAVGMALAAKMRKETFVTYVSFGEGSSNQGDFHEGCNFAGVHKLPVIFFCENNQYAISVPLAKQVACEHIADRALGYGFPGVVVDGNDVLEVYRVTKEAVDRARRGDGPTLIEALTYRLTPHSSDDDDRAYRSKEEVDEAKAKDAMIVFKDYLVKQGLLDESKEKTIRDRLMQAINEATDYAQTAQDPPPQSTLDYVFAN